MAAWVGAVSGVGAILWDFFKWKTSGPKIEVLVSPNMVMIPTPNMGTKYITARVRNIGTSATTITNMCFATYGSRRARRKRKFSYGGVVASSSTTQPLPFKLEVGAEWMGTALQNVELEKLMDAGDLWCEIYHSWSKKPVQTKIGRVNTAS